MTATPALTKSLSEKLLFGAIMLVGWIFVFVGGIIVLDLHADPDVPWYFESAMADLTVAVAALLTTLVVVLRQEARRLG